MFKVGKENVNRKLRNCKEKVKDVFWTSCDNYLTSLSTYKLIKYWRAGNKL